LPSGSPLQRRRRRWVAVAGKPSRPPPCSIGHLSINKH
jgi:hypothetical protein